MNSTNSTTNDEFGFTFVRQPSAFIQTMRFLWCSGAVFLAFVNAGIGLAFLIQKMRRPVRVSPSGLLVLNLVFADTMSSTTIPMLSSRLAAVPHLCSIWTSIMFFTLMGAQFALINVVVDRFLAIVYTLQYRGWMSKRRSIAMVLCGWSIPIAGLIYGIMSNDWNPGPAKRCPDIPSVGKFHKYVFVPVHASSAICVIVVQCCVYVHLRRHDAKRVTSNAVGSSSHKAARILFWVVTPMCIGMLCFDAILAKMATELNWVIRSLYMIIVLFVVFGALSNAVVYSYATANIKNPITDLCKDIKAWFCISNSVATCASQKPTVFVIEPESSTNVASSEISLSISDNGK